MMKWGKLIGLAMLPALVHSFASTDSIQDADPSQSGYLPNHNMDPAMVGSSLTSPWKMTFNNLEMFYAKPLVYTPPGASHEQVIVVSNQNIVRVLDGLTGATITSRTLLPPFASSDTSCGDIPNTVGITGTPIIDPSTSIMYFFSKGYKNGQSGPQGTINGAYRMYAVKLPSLVDAFPPVLIDGHYADNDHTRYFVGGTVLNRPGLAMVGSSIVAGFGGHCDNFNYTGMLVAVGKTAGVGVTSIQAMEASPFAPSPQTLDITIQGGGKAGIWHSGMGLAADVNRVFLVTGNARGAGQNKGAAGTAASGKTYLSTLEQAVVDFSVSSTGVLTQADYFEPYAYDSLNGGDRDFGSSGVAVLDPVFSGGGVTRVAVAGGKDGHVYIMDANNLGGFAGAGGGDKVLQIITNTGALLSGAASYPLEGGYLYLQPSGQPLMCYKLTHDGAGRPQFTLAGQSSMSLSGKSVPTVTSNKGKAGSGIVWVADGGLGLVAFNAVPSGGVLTQIKMPTAALTGGATKYQRAVFGAGRAYVAKSGTIVALAGGGTAASLPLTCTPSDVAFGQLSVDKTSVLSVTCSASSDLTITGCSATTSLFQCGSSALPPTVASGASFTFPVTFNLTDANLLAYENANGAPVVPGDFLSMLNLFATDSTGTISDMTIPLSGTVVATGGYLVLNQTTVDFGAAVVNGPKISRSIILSNDGAAPLTFTGFAYQDFYGGMNFVNVTSTTVGNGYTSPGFPAVGSKIQPGSSITIQLFFAPSALGIAASYLTFWSDGGYTDILMTGNAQSVAVSSSSTSTSATSSVVSSSSLLSSSSVLSSSALVSSSSSVVSSSSILSSSDVVTSSSVVSSAAASSISSDIGSFSSWTDLSLSSSAAATSSTDSGSSSPSSTDQSSGTTTPIASSSSVLSTSLFKSTLSSVGPSSNTASTTSSFKFTTLQTLTSSTLSLPTATASSGFTHQGCFRDLHSGHALPLLISNKTVTPELCLAYVQQLAAKPTPTVLPYFYLESKNQCYGGSSFNWASSAITSLTGTKACTDVCTGSLGAATTGTAKCGGSKMFDLYVASGAPTLSAVYTLTK